MQFTDLPYTLFLEIFSYLSPADTIACRRVSRDAWHALTRVDLSISLILTHFPRSREGRRVQRYIQNDDRDVLEAADDWPRVFARLARRYFHLGTAKPWKSTKIDIMKDADRLRGVTPWNRILRLDDKTASFHYWDPVWTCAPEDGLLVYPAPESSAPGYRARDLETGLEVSVPFETLGKIVRRVRLCDGVLVFEWCEEEAYHPLNVRTAAHRHFATAFDVQRAEGSETPWSIEFRCEWKIHYLGLPLTHHDRFFSAHNRTHYAIYMWQPTRSPWGETDPLERLIIWELGDPSPYRPSEDPSGKNKPDEDPGPHIIRRLINDELSAWGIRQRDTPSLRGLALDATTWDTHTQSACGHVFITEEEHRWSAGPHSSPSPPRLHRVKSTGIPLVGDGPRWVDDCGGSSNGGGMSFCWRGPRRRRGVETTWAGRAPCWRHDDFPYLTVSEVLDAAAGVRFSARQCFMLETLSVHIRPRLRVQGIGGSRRGSSSSGGSRASSREDSHEGMSADGDVGYEGRLALGEDHRVGTKAQGPDGEEVQFADEMWDELLGKGFICGDERWLVGEDRKGRITVLQF